MLRCLGKFPISGCLGLHCVLFSCSTFLLLSCFRVSGCGLGEAVLGLFAQDHGMVCIFGVVWVSVGQSTSSRYACSVARVRAGRVLMVGMVDCHCCVGLPWVGRSARGIRIAIRRCVRWIVLWFALHRCGPASLRARSPSHRRSHV
jgi:hypothetical protein